MSAASQPEPDLDLVQGNIVGFNKDHQRFVFLAFQSAAAGRAFLGLIEPDIASAREVKVFNGLFKEISRRRGEKGIVEASWTNIALSAHGLQVIEAPGLDSFPEVFREGMAARASIIGDVDDSAPATWVPPFSQQTPVDAVVILAADSPFDLEASYGRLQQKLAQSGVSELLPHQDGDVRPDPNRGHEHFGFKDGISQPGIARLTQPSKHGQETIATGEFIIGYPDETGHISGEATPAPTQGQAGYPTDPGTPALPSWTKDGSFVVFRRLRQNVGAFKDFLSAEAASAQVTADLLGAKLVGRWRSGAPLERTRNSPKKLDPSAEDPSITHPSILSDHHINDFVYEPDDADGHLVPRAAHIRKVNPRNQVPPGEAETRRHRILRRGIPYGPEFQTNEQPYPTTGPIPDTQDRGLLFVCYQASIERGFEFLQTQWVNQTDFPQAGDGRDPIVSQDMSSRPFNLTPQGLHLEIARWVTTTGGEYFFAPSLAAIKTLSSEA
jgi:Dyp-type peroxidase family